MHPIRLAVVLAVCAATMLAAQTISTSEAAKRVGEKATVCGAIAGEHTSSSSRGTPTFINLDKPYPNQVFTILVWGNDRGRVGNLPTSGQICATGVVTEYRGSPEIVLHDSHSWYIPKQIPQ